MRMSFCDIFMKSCAFLGHFVVHGMFSDGLFRDLGCLVMGPLVMGHCVMGHFVMGRFVMGRFVCESKKQCTSKF
jgi:hypothetical protein